MKNFDFWLVLPALFLSILGLVTLYSIAPEFFQSQAIYLAISLVVFLAISQIDALFFTTLSTIGYLLSLLLLGLTLLLGQRTREAARWLAVGSVGFQPSEIVKPFLILFFANLLAKEKGGLLKSLLALVPPVILIFLQPDLGSALVILAIWLGMVLAKGVSFKTIGAGALILAISLPLFWKVLAPYQKQRLTNFLNPGSDPQGASYSQIQAKISIGSGQFLGKGLGHGTQSVLKFLPEYQSDFIFAAFGEEWGFVGVSVVLFLYFVLLARLLSLAGQTESVESLIFIGIFSFLFFQTAVHIGMNLGLLPITGLTLPFISSGGSSLLACWMVLGIATAME